ncbi:MAG: nuclear transport factor 2 family protein [Solirubrobacteraceae bacterium]
MSATEAPQGLLDARTQEMLDRLAIRELIDDWTLLRDARQWDRWLALWHEGGVMITTWGGRTSPEEYAEKCQAGYARGDRILLANGGTSIQLAGDRAVSQSKVRITQMGPIEGVACEVTCLGRNFDFCERRHGRWGFVLRQPIYEHDMVMVVDPTTTTKLKRKKLARYPDGYARLAYMQDELGYRVPPDMPVLDGPELEALDRHGELWLTGHELTWAGIAAPPD